MKRLSIIFGAILLVLGWFALSPTVWAVSPPPDGGYANFNTAEGQNALNSLTTGIWNVADGAYALSHNTDGSYNTAVGTAALLFNIGDQSTGEGTQNTAVGAAALLLNTTGSSNSALGLLALQNNTTGNNNTAIGGRALQSNTTGADNTASGSGALINNTSGIRNTAMGRSALADNQTGGDNTATGANALTNNRAFSNTADGSDALSFNTGGSNNVAVGGSALFSNTVGSYNVAVGVNAGGSSSSGNNVVSIGSSAGFNHQTGDNDLYLGSPGVDTESGTVRIGTADGVHTRMFLAGVRGVTTGLPDAIPVYIDSAGQLGTASSSRRFKHDIEPMDKVSEAILALKPVTFHYKSDNANTPQFGLIAEEVANIDPDLVVHDKDGQIYTVRYDAVNAMLLNEFLKEHRKVDQLEKQVAALSAGLQKVSAEIELSKGATQTVADKE